MRWLRRWLKRSSMERTSLVPVDTGALKESGHVEERRGGASGEPGGRRIMPGPDWPGWRPEQRPLIGPPK